MGRGSYALVLGVNEDIVLRLSYEELPEFDQDFIIKPIATFNVNDVIIHVLPKLPTLHECYLNGKIATRNEIDFMLNALGRVCEQSGIYFWDNQANNILILEDGTPIIGDLGAVKEKQRDGFIYTLPDVYPLGWDGKWEGKQEALHKKS